MRGEGKATSLWEVGGGVPFRGKGGDVLFSEGRREAVLFPVGRGPLSLYGGGQLVYGPLQGEGHIKR